MGLTGLMGLVGLMGILKEDSGLMHLIEGRRERILKGVIPLVEMKLEELALAAERLPGLEGLKT